MSTSVRLNNFTDFDRLLGWKNLLLTLIGAAAAFSLSYFQLFLPVPFPPYMIAFSLAIMFIVIIQTRNIASAIIIGLGGTIGLVSVEGGAVDFIAGYIVINVLILLIMGILADRLRLIMDWTFFYLLSAMLFSVVSLTSWYYFSESTHLYYDLGYEIGSGGDPFFGTDFPVAEGAVLLGLILLVFIFLIFMRSQILLSDSAKGRYKIFGWLFVLIGQAFTIVPIFMYLQELDVAVITTLAETDWHIGSMEDLFLNQADGPYPVFSNPFNIFFVMPVTYTFTVIGIALLTISKHGGNLEGVRGKSDIVHIAAPLAIIFYFIYASEFIQGYIAPDGFFIANELLPVYATVIWLVYYINQMVARVVLLLIDQIRKKKN